MKKSTYCDVHGIGSDIGNSTSESIVQSTRFTSKMCYADVLRDVSGIASEGFVIFVGRSMVLEEVLDGEFLIVRSCIDVAESTARGKIDWQVLTDRHIDAGLRLLIFH